MNIRKKKLLDRVVTKEKKYRIIFDGNEIYIKNKQDKYLKPFYYFNKNSQVSVKKYYLYETNTSLEFSEYELYAYISGFKVIGERFDKRIYEKGLNEKIWEKHCV